MYRVKKKKNSFVNLQYEVHGLIVGKTNRRKAGRRKAGAICNMPACHHPFIHSFNQSKSIHTTMEPSTTTLLIPANDVDET